MSTQPPSRTSFYLDKRRGKIMGVCSGIADYTGIDLVIVRIFMFIAFWMSGGGILPFYIATGLIANDKPREFQRSDPEDQRFWQGVRASPAGSARDLRARMRSIDRRLADVEAYVTTTNHSLEREIEQLR